MLDRLQGVDEAQQYEEDGDPAVSGCDEAQNGPLEKPWRPVVGAAGIGELSAKAEDQMRGGDIDGSDASKAVCPAAVLHDAFVGINDQHPARGEVYVHEGRVVMMRSHAELYIHGLARPGSGSFSDRRWSQRMCGTRCSLCPSTVEYQRKRCGSELNLAHSRFVDGKHKKKATSLLPSATPCRNSKPE